MRQFLRWVRVLLKKQRIAFDQIALGFANTLLHWHLCNTQIETIDVLLGSPFMQTINSTSQYYVFFLHYLYNSFLHYCIDLYYLYILALTCHGR